MTKIRFLLRGGAVLLLLSHLASTSAAGQAESPDTLWWSVIDRLPPGVSVMAVDSLYGMVANDSRGISLQLGLFGPEIEGETFHGSHHPRWRYHYRWGRDEQGRCRPTEVTILLRSVIYMPYLENLEEVSSTLRDGWQTYSSNLRTHEEGHREITRQGLVELRERMLDHPFLPCSEYPAAFQAAKDEVQASMQARQREYDAETSHGRTQGATWPPSRNRMYLLESPGRISRESRRPPEFDSSPGILRRR